MATYKDAHAALSVVNVNPAELKHYQRNARTHSKKQISRIAESIRQFGFNNPVLVDADNTIIAGHGRVLAAQQLGWATVPVIQLAHLNEAQRRAYIIADNKLAELAGWDNSLLQVEFQYLETLDGFDMTVTGFEMPEIDDLLQGQESDADDEVPAAPEVPVARPGDLWRLGDHLLYCGNSLERASYERLLGAERARMVFTDPPYNVPIQGHVGGRGKIKHDEFAMASGEMTQEEFTTFLRQACGLMAEFSADGSLHFVCMDWRHMRELLAAGHAVYRELKNICVWNKDRGGMGGLYRSKHELVMLFKQGTAPHVNNVELGKHGRYRTNVWDYPAVNATRKGPDNELAMHPTVKPVRMIADAILDCSNRGDVVLDAFGGSGSTLMAAERTGRRARLVELTPRYVDTAILRWQRAAKKDAVHEATGLTFSQVAAQEEGRP
ncbi:MAG: DNA methylase N-4 [Proteobacteria bacterium]|nr:DNA methylase N-4 [Pseudomonadota bacterium]